MLQNYIECKLGELIQVTSEQMENLPLKKKQLTIQIRHKLHVRMLSLVHPMLLIPMRHMIPLDCLCWTASTSCDAACMTDMNRGGSNTLIPLCDIYTT